MSAGEHVAGSTVTAEPGAVVVRIPVGLSGRDEIAPLLASACGMAAAAMRHLPWAGGVEANARKREAAHLETIDRLLTEARDIAWRLNEEAIRDWQRAEARAERQRDRDEEAGQTTMEVQ